MSTEIIDADMTSWFPTYGLLTSSRIFERFSLRLSTEQLVAAIRNQHSIYYELLRVPLKNVFNGIILQQAYDYQVYAQKLFVDYLLSGEGSKSEEAPGGNTREDLELKRIKLMALNEQFTDLEASHSHLIAKSQEALMQCSKDFKKTKKKIETEVLSLFQQKRIEHGSAFVEKAVIGLMIHVVRMKDDGLMFAADGWSFFAKKMGISIDTRLQESLEHILKALAVPIQLLASILSNYLEKTEDIGISLRSYRSQFYDTILTVTELINLLPEYHVDEEKVEENRASLYFDSKIGE